MGRLTPKRVAAKRSSKSALNGMKCASCKSWKTLQQPNLPMRSTLVIFGLFFSCLFLLPSGPASANHHVAIANAHSATVTVDTIKDWASAWLILEDTEYEQDSAAAKRLFINLAYLEDAASLAQEFQSLPNRDIREEWLHEIGRMSLPEVDQILSLLEENIQDYEKITEFYAILYPGAALHADPERYAEILADMKANGVVINWSNRTQPWEGGYQPDRKGAGRVRFNRSVDLSTLEHEYLHFLDDKENGYPGLRYYLENPNVQTQMEIDAYELEKSLMEADPSVTDAIKLRFYEGMDLFLQRERSLIGR